MNIINEILREALISIEIEESLKSSMIGVYISKNGNQNFLIIKSWSLKKRVIERKEREMISSSSINLIVDIQFFFEIIITTFEKLRAKKSLIICLVLFRCNENYKS